MRRLLLFVLGAAAVLMAAEAGARVAAPHLPDPAPWPTPETRVKSSQMAELGCVHTVLIGTSVTEAGVIPELLPTDAYNAAVPFATPESLQFWYSEFVGPALCPERVLIGLPSWTFDIEEPGDPLLTGLTDVRRFLGPEGRWPNLTARSELVRRRGQLKTIAEQWSPRYRPEDTGQIGPRGNQLGYAERNLQEFPAERRELAGSVNLLRIQSLVDAVADSGATPVLFIEPALCHPGGFCISEEARADVAAQYRGFAQSYGLDIIDLGVVTDIASFADPSHLNRSGSLEFTALLSERLAELFGT